MAQTVAPALSAHMNSVLSLPTAGHASAMHASKPLEKITREDRSLKGSIDEAALPLCNELNQFSQFRTLSSCSGRIVLFLVPIEETMWVSGATVTPTADDNAQVLNSSRMPIHHSSRRPISDPVSSPIVEGKADSAYKSVHTKHGGRLLRVSHHPIEYLAYFNLCRTLDEESPHASNNSNPLTNILTPQFFKKPTTLACNLNLFLNYPPTTRIFEIILKMEPFILHIRCNCMQSAKILLEVAKQSGLKQSGILSVGKHITVALRGSQSFECPIVVLKPKENEHQVLPIVQEEALRHFTHACNRKLYKNFFQMERLLKVLQRYPLKRSLITDPCASYANLLESQLKAGSTLGDGTSSNQDTLQNGKQQKKKMKKAYSIEDMAPGGRGGITAAYSAPYIFVFGKLRKSVEESLLNIYNEENQTWSEYLCSDKLNDPANVRFCDLIALHDGYLALIADRDIEGANEFSIFVFDSHTWLWTRAIKASDILAISPTNRWRHVCSYGTEVHTTQLTDLSKLSVVFVYVDSFSSPLNEPDLWKLEISILPKRVEEERAFATYQWYPVFQKNTLPGLGCFATYSMAYDKDTESLYVLGGQGVTSAETLEKVYSFDLYSHQWSCTSSKPLNFVMNRFKYAMKDISAESNSTTLSTYEENGSCNVQFPSVKTMELLNTKSRKQWVNFSSDLSCQTLLFPKHCQFVKYTVLRQINDAHTGSYIVFIGTCEGAHCCRNIWILNLQSLQWFALGQLPEAQMHVIDSIIYGNCRLYVIGKSRHVKAFPKTSTYSLEILPFDLEQLLKFDNAQCLSQAETVNPNDSPYNLSSSEAIGSSAAEIKVLNSANNLYIGVTDFKWIKYVKHLLERYSLYDAKRKIVTSRDGSRRKFYTVGAKQQSNQSEIIVLKAAANQENFMVAAFIPILQAITNSEVYEILVEENIAIMDGSGEQILMFAEHRESKTSKELDSLVNKSIKQQLHDVWSTVFLSYSQHDGATIGFPHKYEKLGNIVLFSHSEFSRLFKNTNIEDDAIVQSALSSSADILKADTIGLLGTTKGKMRQSQVQIIYGNQKIATVKENGILYRFDVTKCMFSSGNTLERKRIAEIVSGKNNLAEVVVDMFCGIGYFSIPILARCGYNQLSHLYGCDWNPDALKAFQWSANLNNIDNSRFTLIECDNRHLGLPGCSLIPSGIAHRVLLGLIPSSEESWSAAVRLLDKAVGGYIHVHGLCNTLGAVQEVAASSMREACNSTLRDIDFMTQKEGSAIPKYGLSLASFSVYVRIKFLQLLRIDQPLYNWDVIVRHTERVKSYAPKLWHCVVDIECRPSEKAST